MHKAGIYLISRMSPGVSEGMNKKSYGIGEYIGLVE